MRLRFAVASSRKRALLSGFLLSTFTLFFFLVASSTESGAIPAFARKYGLPCSACHEAWPMLNVFGQTFKDNGYQLMNDRDSPIWQNPSYWPATFRITPHWHRESVNTVSVDTPAGANAGLSRISSNGFDLTGLDFHTGGTLYQNISFYVLPSSDATGAFHFETVMARIDNIAKSSWLNLKLGKYELDNIISEKRILTISNNGGVYHLYHFIPPGDSNIWGQMGDNQLGMELMGHSVNDRTRYSVSLLSSNDGTVGLPNRNAYSGFVTASQAFDAGYQGGVDRIGAYYFGGVAPTTAIMSGGAPILGVGNKGFNREGVFGLLYVKKLDFQIFYQHGSDSAFFGTSTPSNAPLPAGARSPIWNGVFVETHYVWNPQLLFIQRSEFIRMSQQAMAGTDPRLGDVDAFTFGYRWYPIMFSRAGFAWHNEYSVIRQHGTAPTGGNLASSSLMAGFDFDF
ncbi:MAG: hypothetical protein JO249_19845 [Acidobacteria bacterium]|nr:hypothetical protein [Acidobacteriota bacterium]